MWNLNNPYEYRNNNLRQIGFKSYASYLKSELWLSIRDRVLLAHRMCQSCGKRAATQVHHRAYDIPTLLGETLACLSALCGGCHRKGERPRAKQQDRYDRLQRANAVALNGVRNQVEQLQEPIDAPPLWRRRVRRKKRKTIAPFSTDMKPRLCRKPI